MLLTTLVFLPSQALANDVCFEEDVAKQVVAELQTCRETEEKLVILFDRYNQEELANISVIDNLAKRLSLTDANLTDQTERAGAYKLEWDKCSDSLTECQQSKPSRVTWFSTGFGSALIVALIIIAL